MQERMPTFKSWELTEMILFISQRTREVTSGLNIITSEGDTITIQPDWDRAQLESALQEALRSIPVNSDTVFSLGRRQ
jgi:hypothetical protein